MDVEGRCIHWSCVRGTLVMTVWIGKNEDEPLHSDERDLTDVWRVKCNCGEGCGI